MPHDANLREQAAEWVVRVGDPAFEDWEAFTLWLSQNPAHAEAYDSVSAAVADVVDIERTSPIPANDKATLPGKSRRMWIGGAIAASLAALIAVGTWQWRDDRYTVETRPGELRTVALGDGGTVELAGGTRVQLDRKDARFASLESGQAVFSVHHDAAHPFRVKLGDDTVVDTGTVFDVRHDSSGDSVAVAEGSVVLNPDRENVHLGSGEMVSRKKGGPGYVLSRIPVEQIGEWRDGRITFRQASLDEIAERLSRATGIAYVAKPAKTPPIYSGSVLVGPLRADPQRVGPLLGVKASRSGNEWVIEGQ